MLFLVNRYKMSIYQSSVSQSILRIDRSTPFDPKTFIGDGWSIEEQDKRAIALTEIELTKVMFDSTLKKREKSIQGEKMFKRLKEKTNRILLDAGIFKTLWENQILIPEKWKEKTNGNTTLIFFSGTVLRDSFGNRYVPCLYWDDRKWCSIYCWLAGNWFTNDPSAVLEYEK
jgi:hypothetical protein